MFSNRSMMDPTGEQRISRDWEMEQRAERKYHEELYGEPAAGNTLWQDYEDNWVEITEFVGLKKPAVSAVQLGLFDEGVA
jgi:hypothetical protein